MSAAHPRSRGENIFHGRAVFLHGGSSPLTRGKLRGVLDGDLDLRLIPAHAGKTVQPRCRTHRPGAHPRSRGENHTYRMRHLVATGSSPLTRGKRVSAQVVPNRLGLIPAHAGKTGPQWLMLSRGTAHPRSRGENTDGSVDEGIAQGSSPLTRGKLFRVRGHAAPLGLIPAHAGKTGRSTTRPRS